MATPAGLPRIVRFTKEIDVVSAQVRFGIQITSQPDQWLTPRGQVWQTPTEPGLALRELDVEEIAWTMPVWLPGLLADEFAEFMPDREPAPDAPLVELLRQVHGTESRRVDLLIAAVLNPPAIVTQETRS